MKRLLFGTGLVLMPFGTQGQVLEKSSPDTR